MKNLLLLAHLLFFATHTRAQDSLAQVVFSGYVEAFYGLDANRPKAGEQTAFLYNHNRQNEVNINLAFLKAAHTAQKTRATLALGVGTYMSDNYAAEPIGARNLLEANIGFRLDKKTWIDLGVLPSHIGFESAISRDCWTLSRSLMAENSPYFESGARLTHTTNTKWQFSALMLNGWQRIARAERAPAFGSQVQWKPREGVLVNWSSYAGHADRSIDNRWRLFQNVYASFPIHKKWTMLTGVDFGTEKNDTWFTAVGMLRYSINDTWSATARYEYYRDPNALVIGLPNFLVHGGSCNLDYSVSPQTTVRLELRYLTSGQDVFIGENGLNQQRFSGLLSVAGAF